MAPPKLPSWVHGAALLLAAGSILPGCSPTEVIVHAKLDPSHENLVHIRTAYVRFNTANRRPPAGPEDLKPFLREFGNPEEILRSPRDRDLYVICWGVDLSRPPSWATGAPVLAYERRPVEGKRYVLTTHGSVSLMGDEEFFGASFPPGHQPLR